MPKYLTIEEEAKLDEKDYDCLFFQINSTSHVVQSNLPKLVYRLEIHRKEKPTIYLNKLHSQFVLLHHEVSMT